MQYVYLVLSEDWHVEAVWSTLDKAQEELRALVDSEESRFYGDPESLFISEFEVDAP
jgi:hypothetical protein